MYTVTTSLQHRRALAEWCNYLFELPRTGTSMTSKGATLCARRLNEEPGTALRFIDPVLEHARSCYVAGFVTQVVGATHTQYQRLVVFPEFAEHAARSDVVSVIIGDAFHPGDMANRS